MKIKKVKEWLSDMHMPILAILAIAMVAAGTYFISRPAAPIAAGILLYFDLIITDILKGTKR